MLGKKKKKIRKKGKKIDDIEIKENAFPKLNEPKNGFHIARLRNNHTLCVKMGAHQPLTGPSFRGGKLPGENLLLPGVG